MDALAKLELLAPETRYEPDGDVGQSCPPAALARMGRLQDCITHAAMPNGRRIALLKTLQTSACERDCNYCAFRQGRDFRRVSFSPDELAGMFMQLQRAGLVEGMFLSSGIAGRGPRTQDRLLDTAEILRRRYHFQGYIHLKIMPGAEKEQILAAMRLADRVSINLEAPNEARLAQLSPHKVFMDELVQRLRWIEQIRQSMPGRWPSTTTQFVVGPAGESDRELLHTTEYLYHKLGLVRAYFSSFSPVPDTPLAHHPPTSHRREQRLYQASFLLRDYGFAFRELPFDDAGNLPLQGDPKLLWAERYLLPSPLEINTATREQLLRVPGIGPQGAERVLQARREGRLRHLGDLRRLGIAAQRAAPFVLLDGRRPARQLSFWDALDPVSAV
ncbi:MAG: radical SAM protein [Chloroflexia bacterium]|nr:radical SAM protein [Chloroflexia bacterium]